LKRLFFVGSLLLCARAWATDPIADATARFLAGLPVRDTPLESYSHDPGWATHATDLDRAWTQLEKEQLAKMRSWAPEALGEFYQDTGPMFYMFSGPDFLYANAFFPNASTYILCGTEPVGPLPEIDKIPPAALAGALANLRKSLDSLLSWSFFITKNMKADLTQRQLSGTLPLLYVFLARRSCTIESVAPVALDSSGNFVTEGKGVTHGVKIIFLVPSGREQTLYYFTTDLADWSVKTNPGFVRFCETQGDGMSLLKAASYLMHSNNFSSVRDFLLNHSRIILQDDSGIPLRFFDKDKWDISHYGTYTGPIDTFKQYPQPDLAKENSVNARGPLPFSFGYRWQARRSYLMIAVRR
jgi:hypothetical protein